MKLVRKHQYIKKKKNMCWTYAVGFFVLILVQANTVPAILQRQSVFTVFHLSSFSSVLFLAILAQVNSDTFEKNRGLIFPGCVSISLWAFLTSHCLLRRGGIAPPALRGPPSVITGSRPHSPFSFSSCSNTRQSPPRANEHRICSYFFSFSWACVLGYWAAQGHREVSSDTYMVGPGAGEHRGGERQGGIFPFQWRGVVSSAHPV